MKSNNLHVLYLFSTTFFSIKHQRTKTAEDTCNSLSGEREVNARRKQDQTIWLPGTDAQECHISC